MLLHAILHDLGENLHNGLTKCQFMVSMTFKVNVSKLRFDTRTCVCLSLYKLKGAFTQSWVLSTCVYQPDSIHLGLLKTTIIFFVIILRQGLNCRPSDPQTGSQLLSYNDFFLNSTYAHILGTQLLVFGGGTEWRLNGLVDKWVGSWE